jgi:hypothetical protein
MHTELLEIDNIDLPSAHLVKQEGMMKPQAPPLLGGGYKGNHHHHHHLFSYENYP